MSTLTEAQLKEFNSLFSHIYKGDEYAVSFSIKLLELIHLWDDLVDKDKAIADADINAAFVFSLTELGSCPLWDIQMAGHMRNVYVRWQVANRIEATSQDENEVSKAWMLRAGCYDLFVMLAAKLHGLAWAEEIAHIVYASYGEKLTDFISEVRQCQT